MARLGLAAPAPAQAKLPGGAGEATPNAALESAPLIEACHQMVAQVQQQLGQASGDSDVREHLTAKLRTLEGVLRSLSAVLLKGHLQRILDTLQDIDAAVESWETSKGFPFLRGASTEVELRRQISALQELLDEASCRASEVGLFCRGAARALSAAAGPPREVTRPLPAPELAPAPLPKAIRGPRCVLVVQKAPHLPGQLQQEWEQAAPSVATVKADVMQHCRPGVKEVAHHPDRAA